MRIAGESLVEVLASPLPIFNFLTAVAPGSFRAMHAGLWLGESSDDWEEIRRCSQPEGCFPYPAFPGETLVEYLTLFVGQDTKRIERT